MSCGPGSAGDGDDYFKSLSSLGKIANACRVRNLMHLVRPVISDGRFQRWPASVKHHHVWEGGLADHTWQVLEVAMAMHTAAYPGEMARLHELMIAAVWHDYGKCWDYTIVGCGAPNSAGVSEPRWDRDRHCNLVRHVSKSFAEWTVFQKSIEILELDCQHIEHLILSHHGRLEWGSPIEPLTAEAMILHQADMLSASHRGGSKS